MFILAKCSSVSSKFIDRLRSKKKKTQNSDISLKDTTQLAIYYIVNTRRDLKVAIHPSRNFAELIYTLNYSENNPPRIIIYISNERR